MSTAMKINHETIQQMAIDEGRTIKSLLALANQNDPFYAGTPSQRVLAEWFADLYRRYLLDVPRFHLRRFHYLLVSQPTGTVMIPAGDKHAARPYENDEASWKDLGLGSRYARYLGFVPINDFEDRRTPDPVIHLPDAVDTPEASLVCGRPELADVMPTPALALDHVGVANMSRYGARRPPAPISSTSWPSSAD